MNHAETDTAEAEIDQIITESLAAEQDSLELEMENQTANQPTTNANEEDTASIEVFNTALHQYLRIDEEIKSLMAAVKERNDIKRKLGDTLSNYLKANQIKKVNLDGSYKGKRLEVEVKTTNTGFNKSNVTEALLSELQEETELFDKIMRAISKTSILKEVWKLKVTEEKATRNASNANANATGKKKGKGRQLGTSMADAAAILDD